MKEQNCQSSLDALFFLVSVAGIVGNDECTFLVGQPFFGSGCGTL